MDETIKGVDKVAGATCIVKILYARRVINFETYTEALKKLGGLKDKHEKEVIL